MSFNQGYSAFQTDLPPGGIPYLLSLLPDLAPIPPPLYAALELGGGDLRPLS